MRNVIFFSLTVLLVSLSVCLAQQNPQPDAKPAQTAPVTLAQDGKPNEVKPTEQGQKSATTVNAQSVAPEGTKTSTQTAAAQEQNTLASQNATNTQQTNSSAPTPTETKTNQTAETKDNKTENKTEKTEPATQKASEEQVVPTKATATAANGTKPDEKADKPQTTPKTEPNEKADAVTPKNETVKPTAAPEAKEVLKSRAFDGPSFVGGIVLTLGLLAISFVGFKYYKNLTKENYHIL